MEDLRSSEVKKKEALKDKIQKHNEKRRQKRYLQDAAIDTITSNNEEVKETLDFRNGIDMRFLIYVIVLLCFGAVMSYSASYVYAKQQYGDPSYFFVRYIIFSLVSIVLTVPFVIYARPRFWKSFGIASYAVSVFLLLLVPVIGSDGGGATRWLDLKIVTVQPSEIAKMAVVVMLALFMSEYEDKIISVKRRGGSFRFGVLFPCLIFGSVCALVALEKHISGLMIIGMIGIAVMYMGGTRPKWIFLIIGAIAVAGCVLILVSSYAQDRVNTWLNIDEVDPLGSAWQTLQGLYAIGSGGIFGTGLGNSRQKYGYVSQPQNDFIFTIICEELGFFGAVAVITVFTLLVIRGFKIAANAPDKFTSLMVFGLTFKVALQVILNIAVVTNSMPNTGISLPFFSSGGTSLALQTFEMGMILSVSRFSTNKK